MSLIVETTVVPLDADDHGVMRVGGTRVRLDSVITAWKQGKSPEEIVESFDVLDLADVYAVIAYYISHRAQVDAYLEQNRLEESHIRQNSERHFPQAGIRARLLARQDAKRQ